MQVSSAQWSLAALLFVCLASFGWAMRGFFIHPAGTTLGMRITGVCGTVFAILHFAAILLAKNLPDARAAVAALLYAAALALFWWAISANRNKPLSAVFSPDLPVHIVNHGPYRYIRHPLYCSYLMTWIAGCIGTLAWWLVPTVIVMVIIYIRAARQEEEKFSRTSLAPVYRDYRSRTGLLTPKFLFLQKKTFPAGRSRLVL